MRSKGLGEWEANGSLLTIYSLPLILLKNPMNASTRLSMNGKSSVVSMQFPFVLSLVEGRTWVFQQNHLSPLTLYPLLLFAARFHPGLQLIGDVVHGGGDEALRRVASMVSMLPRGKAAKPRNAAMSLSPGFSQTMTVTLTSERFQNSAGSR